VQDCFLQIQRRRQEILHPTSLENRLTFFHTGRVLHDFDYSRPVGIWIKIHLNPKTRISHLLLDVSTLPEGFERKTFKI
jgi:hypothetical protein